MLRVLIKNQLSEIFRGYFYNRKNGAARSKASVIAMFILFGVVMVAVLGGMFGGLSYALCLPFAGAGMDWLYFAIMSGLSIFMGAFGSVFNTFSGLYLAKDNDLLLSMPIPVGKIIAARLINVYLLGLMYSAVVIVPAAGIYIALVKASVSTVLCALLLTLLISLIVLVLSCLLGWCVARISLKLKNKSVTTVLIAVACLAAYYVVYFKASSIIGDLIANAAVYGEKIRGAAEWLYSFGKIGTGAFKEAGIAFAVVFALMGVCRLLLSKSFTAIATASGKQSGVRHKKASYSSKGVFSALLSKEAARFVSSPNYMLNCGLGILFMPAAGIALLIKGEALTEAVKSIPGADSGTLLVIASFALCMLSCINDICAPSVSLEGKGVWIAQSLPVKPSSVLLAKAALDFILTAVPLAFALVCALWVLPGGAAEKLFFCTAPLAFSAFSAAAGTLIGLKTANLSWTSELIPIKQSAAVTAALLGGWAIALAGGAGYLPVKAYVSPWAYLAAMTVVFTLGALLTLKALTGKAASGFTYLS